MTDSRNLTVFWLCAVLAMAIAMASVGLVVLYEALSVGMATPGRIQLQPGGGILSLLLGAGLLSVVFRQRWFATVLASMTILLAISFFVLPMISNSGLVQSLSLNPVLLLIISLMAISILAAIWLRKGWRVGLVTAVIGFFSGLLSLLSHWSEAFAVFALGTIPESTIVVGPLVMLISIGLPFLGRIFHQKEKIPYKSLVALGAISILVTTLCWHLLRIQHSNYVLEQAETLADQLVASSVSAYNVKLALIQRLAERWQIMDGVPPEALWHQEVSAYLRDFPDLQLITLLDSRYRPIMIESRSPNYRFWLQDFLGQTDSMAWLDHVTESTAPHLSPVMNADNGRAHAAIVVPVPITSRPELSRTVLTVVDMTHVYETLTRHIDPDLIVAISDHGHTVFDTHPHQNPAGRIHLVSRDIEAHHETQWALDISIPEGELPPGQLYLPPLLLFTGLGLSFMVMISHQFWRESEKRSKSLKSLNETLNFHLDQERQLRHTNQRILEFSWDILCSISRDGRFLQVSPACEDILGYQPAELLGKPYSELLVPEDQAPSEEEIRLLMSGEHTKTSGFRNRMIHRNGHVVTISWSAEWSDQEHALFCVGRDISDQLVAETLTRERDQFFSLSPDMFCIVDLNTHFFETNNTFVETLGYSRGELIGTSYMEIIHPDDQAEAIEAVRSLITGQDVFDLLIRLIDKNGEAHWLHINAILSADDLIYVVARDTTEQRRIEQKLRENEALLKMAERVAMLGGWVVDLNTGKSTWSDAVCSIHDLAPGQAPNVEDALQFYIPEHRERITNAVQTCIETGIPFDEDLQIRTAEGRLRWVRAIGHGVKDNNGEISGLQGALQDITASRLAKEELERSNRELQDFAFVASHDLQEPLRKIQAFSDRLVSRSENLNDQEKDYLQRMQSAAGRMQNLIEDLLSYSRVTTRARPMVSCDTGAILQGVLQDMETTISREQARVDVGELPDAFGDATQLRQVLQNLLSNAIKFHAPDQPPDITVRAEDVSEDQWTLIISDQGIGFDERYAEKLFHPFQRLHQKAGFAGTGIGMAIVKKILDRHGASVTVKSTPGEGTTFRIRFSRG